MMVCLTRQPSELETPIYMARGSRRTRGCRFSGGKRMGWNKGSRSRLAACYAFYLNGEEDDMKQYPMQFLHKVSYVVS